MGPRFRGGDELGNMHSNDGLSSWEIVEQIQQICPTGKSLLIFRNQKSSLEIKNILLRSRPKSVH
jgi:hypothetical protein